MEPTTIIVMGVAFLATLIRGFLGFGNALVAMPLLAFVLDMKTVTPLVALLAMFKATLMLARSWRSICFRSTWRMLVATAFGTPIGLFILKGAHEQFVQLLLAAVIILFSLYNIFHPRLFTLKTDRGAYVAGFLAGLLGGAYNTNGPPIVIYGTMRRWDPEKFRATLQGFFWPANVLILTGHAVAGLWTKEVFFYLLVCIPVMVPTLALSHRLGKNMNKERFDKILHGVLIALAIALATKALV